VISKCVPLCTAPEINPKLQTLNAKQVISMSHFVPRLELVPEKRFLVSPELPKVFQKTISKMFKKK
jgi:hypothetical protein